MDGSDELKVKSDLFKDVQFSLCEDVFQSEQVKKVLLTGGAKFVNYLSDNVTHVVGDNCEHPSVSEAVEIYEKPVVTSRWVWLSAKASVLLPTAGFSPFKNQLFSGITACPSNISEPDVQSLWAMITYYGGSFELILESECTHLISTKPEGVKYEKAIQTNDKIKIVTPDWVIDSVKSKAICDEDLYHPRLLLFNNQSSNVNKVESETSVSMTSDMSSGPVITTSLPLTPNTSMSPHFTLRSVTLPTTAMITTFTLAQTTQNVQTCSPTSVQGGRVRVFLPPQHQVRLMQMKQNQIRQLCPPGVQQVVNVQQILQQRQQQVSQQQQPLQQQQQSIQQLQPQQLQQLQSQHLQTQQAQQQENQQMENSQQWNNNQQFISQQQTVSQNSTTQPIQVLSQTSPDFAKLRPTLVSQQTNQQQPRQVYLAVQQQQIRQPLVQVRQQHFISVQQQSQLQQQRPQSNIIIQQRPSHPNVQSVRLQQAPQHLIQLQQRQPITLQSGQQAFVRAPQQIIIQQQNQQAIQRQIQMQQQVMQGTQSYTTQAQTVSAIGHPQVQQRMATRMPQQFTQQNQMRGQQIRGPISTAPQQMISTAMPSGQPRVFMKAQSQYPIVQQQFEQQPNQALQSPQFVRAQTPPQPQLQFIRNPQWQTSQDSTVPSQQLSAMRPQHILVTTQPQTPSQQQIIQWQQQQQQQQDIQRRQLMQQQNQQRLQMTAVIQPEKVRPSVSVGLPTGDIQHHHIRQEDLHQNQNQLIQIRFFAYDPRIQIPLRHCLIGCVLYLTGYEKVVDLDLINIWKNKLIKQGAEIEDNYTPRTNLVICENYQTTQIQQVLREGKRCVSIFYLDDVLSIHKLIPPSKFYHLPFGLDENQPCKHHTITITKFDGIERQRIKDMIKRTGAKYTPYMTQKNTIIICKRLEGAKYKKAVEWRLAIVNVVWLHDVVFGQLDALQLSTISKKYQQFDLKDPFRIDYSTVPNLMNPWRTPLKISEEQIKAQMSQINDKQSKLVQKDDIENKKENHESEESNEPQMKKMKLIEKNAVVVKEEFRCPAINSLPSLQTQNPDLVRNIKVMLTAINDNRDRDELKTIVLNLGAKVTNNWSECTHLISDRIARTVKFMCAFSSSKFILKSDWILESGKRNEFISENEYVINDRENEIHFNFSLENSLKIRNKQLFKGFIFHITKGCIPSPSILKDIIESVGGYAVIDKRPTKTQLTRMRETGLKFSVITCENDLHLCDVFFSRQIHVLNVEFILSGILRQEINYELYNFKQSLLD